MSLIPIYLEDSTTGAPVTGLTFASGELRVSLNGAAFGNALGAIVEVGGSTNGRGAYLYTPSLTEGAASRLTLSIVKTGVLDYGFESQQPVVADLAVGDGTVPRLVMVRLTDPTTRAGVGSVASAAAAGLYVSSAGGAWLAATGSWTEVTGTPAGYYAYVLDPSEVQAGLVMVLATAYQPYLAYRYASPQAATPPAPPVPIPSPIAPTSPEFVDYIAIALARLGEQYKSHGSR